MPPSSYVENKNVPLNIGTLEPAQQGYNNKKPGQPGEPATLIDLKVYADATKKPNPLAAKQGQLPLQPLMLSSPYFPPQFQTYLSNFMKNFYTPFIYKDYNINIGGPNADHYQASMLYEDALPSTDIYLSYKSLRERNNLLDYVRSTFIMKTEGEYIDWAGGKSSLNSRLKLIKLSPYGVNIFSNNPYTSLPEDLLLYTSCYPIQYDKEQGNSQCQKNSVGMNVRIYKLTINSLFVKFPETKHNNEFIKDKKIPSYADIDSIFGTPEQYNIWRDFQYYEFIRNSINRKLISPNFIQSYCYFLNEDANMTFTKNGKTNSMIKPTHNKNDPNITTIILTESPTYSLLSWTSNNHQIEKNIKKQTFIGLKSYDRWKTIIFQMLSVFLVMHKYKFTFEDMNIPNNFFIKELNLFGDGGGNQFWIYKINNVEFYVPCKGDLLLIDHDYHDFDGSNEKFKIIGNMYSDYDNKLCANKIRENAINCINVKNFKTAEKPNFSIVPPPELIIKLIDNINNLLQIKEKDIYKYTYEDIIYYNFGDYFNNRVGTMIRDTEKSYILKHDIRPFNIGELVINELKYDTYEIILFLGNKDKNFYCATKENNEIIYRDYNKDSIYHYSNVEIIRPDILPGQPSQNMDNIIETYTI